MTVLDHVFGSLQHMTLAQLLFGFFACICYATLQGTLFGGRVKNLAGALAVASALAFVMASSDWVLGFILLVFAVGGLGVVSGLLWLLGLMLGFNGRSGPQALDSALGDPTPDGQTAAAPASRPAALPPAVAPSR